MNVCIRDIVDDLLVGKQLNGTSGTVQRIEWVCDEQDVKIITYMSDGQHIYHPIYTVFDVNN